MTTKALTPHYRLRLGLSRRMSLVSVVLLVMAASLLLAGNRPVNSAPQAAPNIDIQEVRSTNADGLSETTADFGAQKRKVPNKTTGTLVCRDGSPLSGVLVTAKFFAGGVEVASQSATTDAAGHFEIVIVCANSSQSNRHFVISAAGCSQTWKIASDCCCGDLQTLTCDSCGGCITPPADMVAWWPFDETSGLTAQDISGVNNLGTHVNGPTPNTGIVAGALCFDGVNDYVQVADHTEVNFLGDCSNDAAEAFTIDAWVRTTQSSGLAVILDKRSIGPVGYHLFLFNGRLGFQMAVPGSFTNFVAPASGAQFVNVANGSWNLVTVTATRCRGGQGRLYVNGNLVQSFVPLVGGLNNPAKLNIGRRDPAFGASSFRGCIDELEMFKRALSNTEVMALFNAGSKGKCKPSPSPLGSLTARVVDRKGRPVQGVEVKVPDREPVTTNANGEFTLKKLVPTERLAVSFSAKGFVSTTRVYPIRSGVARLEGNVVVIWPRAAAVILKARKGGKVTFDQGGGLTIPPDSLVDKKGRPLIGKVRVSLTYLDVSDPKQIRTAPGDFTARMQDGTIRSLESFGIFEVIVEDDTGRRAELASGKTAALELPIPRSRRGNTPRSVGLFSFEVASGQWLPAGTLGLSDDGLTYNGTISVVNVSWNGDDPLDTTCIRIQLFEPGFPTHGPPAANCYVEAAGSSYTGLSYGYTDANGQLCLLVKLNAQVAIDAHCAPHPTWGIPPFLIITTPNIVAGAADCGNLAKCPIVEVVLDIITGDGRATQVKSSEVKKPQP